MEFKTLKEAILQSLEDLNNPNDYIKIYKHIVEKNYYNFINAKTPQASVGRILGDFIRNGDQRVKRIKKGNYYYYYLSKFEDSIKFNESNNDIEHEETEKNNGKNYIERDLHKLLSTYLSADSEKIYTKTIFHESSKYKKDNNQKWTHPDIVGVKFLNFKSEASKNLLKAINTINIFNIYSYELKKDITNDYDLKTAYFQAVSNSSWANYGYLVALDFSDNLYDEMERLNQSFGIGILKLSPNAFKSKIIFPARYHNLDFKTIDKISSYNEDFEAFIEKIEKLINAEEKYYDSTMKEFESFCDDYFNNETELENYCKVKKIPFEEKDFE
jgi:hypothetical protein